MTCILADDEEPARRLLQEYILKTKGLTLESSFATGLEARNYLTEHTVDLAFLDINMPELTGTALVRSLRNKPLIIFTTAYSEYALESFELDVIDYLTKPFPFERFIKAVNKAMDYYGRNTTAKTNDYFFVKADYKLVKINYKDILYIEGLREYVRIHTIGKKIITLLSMNKLETELPTQQFVRIHKSTIVNIDHIVSLHNNIVEVSQQQLSVGATYKETLHTKLQEKGIY